MNKKLLLIGTTAITRHILHNDNMLEWTSWINNINKDLYKIVWFINIDVIEKLNETYKETKINFEKLNKHNFEIHFLKSDEPKGNFLKACQRVSSNIKNYVDNLNLSEEFKLNNIKIMWLEDDWKLNINTNININDIINYYSTTNSHINLSFIRTNYVWALAPSIISYNLWLNLHCEAWEKQIESIDPEHCVGLYYRNKYGNPDDAYNLTVSYTKNKKKHLIYTNSYYTYNKNIIHSDKHHEQEDKYIKYTDVKTFFDDKMLFVRITPNFCIDGVNYGRNFMEKYDLKKAGQDKNNTDFYK